MFDYEKIKEYDKNKTKVLKYVLYKKRTESVFSAIEKLMESILFL